MKNQLLFLGISFFLFILLAGCQITPTGSVAKEKAVSLENILLAFKGQVSFEETNINQNNVFQKELNGVKPNVYNLDKGVLSIYVFSSAKELEEGKKEFEKSTATASLESYKEYTKDNILIFFTNGSTQTEEKIQDAISRIDE